MRSSLPVTGFLFTVVSIMVVADRQTGDVPLFHAQVPHAQYGDRPMSPDALANVRSLVWNHIANITAIVTEEYLKDSLFSGIRAGLTNESASTLKSPPTVDSDSMGDRRAFGMYSTESPDHNAAEEGLHKVSDDEDEAHQGSDSASTTGLLALSWPLLSIKPLVALCSPACNCNNNPTSVCCLKICGHSMMAVADQDGSSSKLVDAESETGTDQVTDTKMPTSCICDCNNNPTTVCCLKICGRSRTTVMDQRASTTTSITSEATNAQIPLSEGSPDSDQIDQAQIPPSCPCDCNNAKTPCCLKLCVNRLKARIDQQGSASSIASPVSSKAHAYEKPDAGLGDASNDVGLVQRNGNGVGMVALRASEDSFLTVQAEFDLDLYPSFVSTRLIQKLGLTAQVNAMSDKEKSKLVINNRPHQVVGTVPITVEAYTRKNPAFEGMFLVFEDSHDNVDEDQPELFFGIDHVRQTGGLALKGDFFA